ncbi:VOC family protein [Chelatococcus reniformis]|uniref:VOC family protein n=1 Tax=Chelatococcus reniformis TaxID=1494448 RepID=A0A916XC31_9HYPH|nr:VOC family protein [Chelatococcus reniformis]GGC60836.1 VOC family protein [Chelatococcus reniformis]
MPTIVSHLWFEKDARRAVERYVSLVPGSAVISGSTLAAETPSGPPGSVEIIEFRLGDQHFVALQAGPLDPFNHSFSIQVRCESQTEIDRIWDGLLADGGAAEQCGWLRDRWGLCWQVVPRILGEMAADPDRARAKRVTEAMLEMVRIDIAALERAYRAEA